MSLAIPATTGWAPSYGAYANAYSEQYARSSQEYRIAQVLNKPGAKVLKSIMRALNGVAPGASVVVNHVRVPNGRSGQMGFKMTEVQTPITEVLYNGVTTTAQRNTINQRIYDAFPAPAYAVDISGNNRQGK